MNQTFHTQRCTNRRKREIPSNVRVNSRSLVAIASIGSVCDAVRTVFRNFMIFVTPGANFMIRISNRFRVFRVFRVAMSSTRGPDIAPVVTNVPGIAVTRSQSSIPAASVTPVALRQPSAPVPAKHVPASASTPVKFTFNVTASPATFNHMLVQQPSREFMRTVEPVSIEMPSTQPESPQPFATPSRTAGAASPFNAFVSQQRDTMSRASYAALPTAESVLAEVPPSPAVPLLNLSKTPIDQFVPSSARESPSLSPPPTAIAHAAFAQKSARRVVVSPPPSSSLLPPPNANATPRRSGASLASTAAAVFGASPHTAVIQDFPSGIGPQAIGRAAFKSSHIAASPSPRRQATNQMSTSLLSAGAMTGAVAAGAESIIATKHAARLVNIFFYDSISDPFL
jgi:hypothetical protein